MLQTDNAGARNAPQSIVYVVDDEAAMRDALKALLDSVDLPCRCYASAEAFLDALPRDAAGCVILDLRMPGMSGLEAQAALDKRGVSLPIIFLTGHGNINAAVRAMHGGAADFITKPVDDERLLEKVRAAIEANEAEREGNAARARVLRRLKTLTPREREVLDGVVDGLSNKRIARRLGISHKTVELHRGHMMEKMEAGSIAEVVQMHDIADPPKRPGADSVEIPQPQPAPASPVAESPSAPAAPAAPASAAGSHK